MLNARKFPPRVRFVQMLERLGDDDKLVTQELEDLSLTRLAAQVAGAKASGWRASKRIEMRRLEPVR